MSLASLIDTYGYLAILVGTFFEGETILVLGGFAAHRGYLHLPWVILAAFIGTLLGDQLFFVLGRWHSEKILAKRPSWKRRVEKAQARIRGFRIPFLIVFRFLYGLRSVTPFVVGMSDVPAPLFLFLNALGAMIWAVAVGTGGYLFGNVLEIFIANVKRYELYVFVTIAAVGAVIWIVRLASRRRRAMPSNKTGRENGPL
jgi:membrane protein DedA with SNARE-associated domain